MRGRPKFDFHTGRGEVPREAPHELDARRVVGAAAQERDLGVEGRGAERAEVRSNLCGNQPVRRVHPAILP